MSERAQNISIYALCGSVNFSSIDVHIGGSVVLASERRRDLAELGLKAMDGGVFARCLTACFAGLMLR